VLWKSGLGMRSDEALSKMEEGPPEIGLQGQVPNRHKLRG
jgi:hypothetical protein